jgi:hypothetical protein
MSTKQGAATPPQWRAHDGLRSWLQGKTGDDLDVIEFGPRPAYLEHIVRRNPKSGERESVAVRICAPTHVDRCRARIEALEWVQKLARLDKRPTWQEACDVFGPVYVDELDTVCLVARITRDHDAPEHQHRGYEALDELYGRASVMDLWERINVLDAWTDPRATELSEDDFWAVVATIDKVKNTSPLAAIAGGARDSFVTSMASRLLNFRISKSPSPSGATSTRARSG